MLASATPAEQERFSELQRIEPATLANFRRELNAWRRDLSSSPENIGLFYFAGHGIQRSGADMVLLLDDFLEGYGDGGMLLEKGVDFFRLYQGMATNPPQTNEGARQFYFLDTCRKLPKCFQDFEYLATNSVFDLPAGGQDSRNAPIFFGAIPGAAAYEISDEQTLFSRALLRCLDGLAGIPMEEDDEGRVQYRVTVNSLNAALRVAMEELNEAYGGDQVYDVGGHSRETIIRTLPSPPEVDVVLQVDPDRASRSAQVDVQDQNLASFRHFSPVDPHPFRDRWPAGTYTARVRFDSQQTVFRNYARARPIVPPRPIMWKMRVV
jgi:hypothetical protein